MSLKNDMFINCFILCFSQRHQGFGVLSVILANHAIKLLTSLFQDLQVEALHRVRKATNWPEIDLDFFFFFSPVGIFDNVFFLSSPGRVNINLRSFPTLYIFIDTFTFTETHSEKYCEKIEWYYYLITLSSAS